MVKRPIEYSDKPVTPFDGMALMKRFIDQTGIREHLATLDLPQGGSNRAYDPVQVIESFWLGIWTGASRYIHCDWLRPGNTAACSNCVEFMRETFDEAMAGMKVGLVRGDSGFDTDETWSALEERGLNYIIAARAYANLKNVALRCPARLPLQPVCDQPRPAAGPDLEDL